MEDSKVAEDKAETYAQDKGKRRRLKATCHMEANMKLLPHLSQALDHLENGGKVNGNKDNSNPKTGGPPANNPLAAKINLSAKGPMPPPPNNSN